MAGEIDPAKLEYAAQVMARLVSAGLGVQAAAFWGTMFPGTAVPVAADIAAVEGTVITGAMLDGAAVAGAEIVAADAAATIVAVEVEVDAAAAALTGAALTEAEWFAVMRAAAIAARTLVQTVVPEVRGAVILLAVGTMLVGLAAGSRPVQAQEMPKPKKPDNIAACMQSLYSMYLFKSFLLMLSKPRTKYRMYRFDEWRVSVFHPLLKKLMASAPERKRLREKARLDELIQQTRYKRPGEM